jgi:hypothetical protein
MNNASIPANAAAITPSNTANQHYLGIYIGAPGDLAVQPAGGGPTVVFVGVVAGTMLPIEVSKVLATGTTAANLVGVW